MKNLVFAVLTLLFASAPAFAECTRTDLIAGLPVAERAALFERAAANPFPEGNIWHAKKPGSEIYVVGTFHLYDPRMDAMMAQIAPLLNGLDRLYVEASPEDSAFIEQRMTSDASLLFLNDGPSLVDLLGPTDWETLETAMQARNVPGFLAAKMQPWYAGMLLALPPCALAQAGEKGLDDLISEAAGALNLDIRSLEDPEVILALLAGDPIGEQLDMLRIILSANDGASAEFSTTVESYFRGEHRLLWEYSKQNTLNDPNAPENIEALMAEFETELLTNRNFAWAELLKNEAATGRFMVAAGAAHLSGDTGVLNLLAKAGYTLTRLD